MRVPVRACVCVCVCVRARAIRVSGCRFADSGEWGVEEECAGVDVYTGQCF